MIFSLRHLVATVLLFSSSCVLSQTINNKIELVIKTKGLTTTYTDGVNYAGGMKSHSTRQVIYFKVGNSAEKKIGYRGRRLAAVLKSDTAAYQQFCVYKKTLNKKFGFKTTKIVSEFVAVLGAIVLFASITPERKTPAGIIVGGTAAVAGVAGAIACSVQENKLYNKSIRDLKKSIEVYNQDLENKAGPSLKD